MAFTSEHFAKLTGRRAAEGHAPGIAPRSKSWTNRLIAADLAAVHFFSGTARSTGGRLLAIAISKLGNGWIYLILAPIILLGLGRQGFPIIAVAGANAAVLHCLYPLLKRRFGRLRPFQVDPRLPSLLKTLDAHSFPSGHAMTLSGVLAPIVLAWPAVTVSAGLLLLSMAWSRIATAHHYPSDVCAGVALGVGVAYPLSSYMLTLV